MKTHRIIKITQSKGQGWSIVFRPSTNQILISWTGDRKAYWLDAFENTPLNGLGAAGAVGEKGEKGVDQAMQASGGIDFNSDRIDVHTQQDRDEIKIHIDRAMLERLQNAPGFEPRVIDMRPLPAGQAGMKSLRMFLGIQEKEGVKQAGIV